MRLSTIATGRAERGRTLQWKAGAAWREVDAAARRLDHVISGHLRDVGAPIELLQLVFEKIYAGEGVAISFDIAPAGIAGNRRIAPAEFPAGMLGANAPALQTYSKGARIERIERRHAIDDNEPVHVELQLHQYLVTKGIDEVGGIGSPAHMADLDA